MRLLRQLIKEEFKKYVNESRAKEIANDLDDRSYREEGFDMKAELLKLPEDLRYEVIAQMERDSTVMQWLPDENPFDGHVAPGRDSRYEDVTWR